VGTGPVRQFFAQDIINKNNEISMQKHCVLDSSIAFCFRSVPLLSFLQSEADASFVAVGGPTLPPAVLENSPRIRELRR